MLVVTPGIANLIRENKTFRITSAIQTGAKFGMQLLDDHLFKLLEERNVTEEDVLVESRNSPDDLAKRIANAERGHVRRRTERERSAVRKAMAGSARDAASG